MKMKNNNFNLIVRSDGQMLLIIFENEYKKNNVKFNIINNNLQIIYINGTITFNKLSKQIKEKISETENILVTEVDYKKNISNGTIIDTYTMKKL